MISTSETEYGFHVNVDRVSVDTYLMTKVWTWMPAVGDLPLIATTTAIKDSTLFLGTQTDGVHYSTDDGLHWSPINVGLQNLDIFTLEVLDNYLYASTHGGLYRLNLDSMITNTKEIAASTF
ncbi:MAG: hypothetical protein IPF81_03445 [Bacteroidetes bacterium]|nr:hypothetical protein [Bacteroidota bacterium]